MEELLRIGFFISALIVVYQFLSTDDREELRKSFLQRINVTTKDQKLDQILENAGLRINSNQFNLIRYSVIGLVIVYGYGSYFVKGLSLDFRPVAIAILIYLSTTTQKYAPVMIIFRSMQKSKERKRNSELVSFLKTYQANKRNAAYQLPLSSLCNQVAENYTYIQSDLKMLSTLITEENLMHALDWWRKRFDERHPFFEQFKNIIATTENEPDHEKSIEYLQSQSDTIANISSKIYKEKWDAINTIATVFNAIPSLLAFVMILALSVELALRTKESGFY